MNEVITTSLEQGLELYQQGEAPANLIPFFKEICDRTPKNASAWACLAWLYLLENQPQLALKAAQKSVKLDNKSPQGRINLALSMLETDTKGVRTHVEFAQQAIALSEEIRQGVEENIEDGLTRKPDWKSLQRIKTWLFE